MIDAKLPEGLRDVVIKAAEAEDRYNAGSWVSGAEALYAELMKNAPEIDETAAEAEGKRQITYPSDFILGARWQHEQDQARLAAALEDARETGILNAHWQDENAHLREKLFSANYCADAFKKERDDASAEVERLEKGQQMMSLSAEALAEERDNANALLEAEGKRLGHYAAALALAKRRCNTRDLEMIDYLLSGKGGEP